MTMITPSYLGETIEYSSLHACRSTLEDPTGKTRRDCSNYRFRFFRQGVIHHGSFLSRRRRQIGAMTLTCVAHGLGTEGKNESDD